MTTIKNQRFDEERALYGSDGVIAEGCDFDGPADGESAFKESRRIEARDCFFNLRYPFWHTDDLKIDKCEMTELCRAALWYCRDVAITDSKLHGIKALRECNGVSITGSDIISPEFGWFSGKIRLADTTATGEYFMLRARDLELLPIRRKRHS